MFSRYLPHIRLLRKVAWGGSVAGLTILAEERRRRLAFAQKVLDNGKALQNHKTYKSSAPLSTFDTSAAIGVGEVYSQEPECVQRLSKLSTDEWHSRRRKRKIAPRGKELTDGRLKRDDIPRGALGCYSGDGRNDDVELSTDSPLSRYELHLHDIVANRTKECFGDGSLEMNARAQEELDAFLSQSPRFLSPCMQHTLAIYTSSAPTLPGLDSQKAALHGEILRYYSDIFGQTSSGGPCPTSARKTFDQQCSRDRNSISTTQSDIAAAICAYVDQKRIHDAFIQFLHLCDFITEPLLTQTERIITNLASACKQHGAFSLVKDIELKALEYFNHWQLVVLDLTWLLSNETSEKRLDLCRSVCMSFLERGAYVEASRVWLIAINYLLDQGHFDQATDLFFEYEDALEESNGDSTSVHLCQRLLKAGVSVGAHDLCLKLVGYLLKRNALCIDLLNQVCTALFQRGEIDSAACIYVKALRESPNPVALYRVELYSIIFTAALESKDFATCILLIEWLRSHDLSLSDALLKATISNIRNQRWPDCGRYSLTFAIAPDGENIDKNGTSKFQSLLAILYSMAYTQKLPECQKELFDIMTRTGTVDPQALEQLVFALLPTRSDVIVEIGARCKNIEAAKIRCLEFILISAVEQREKNLAIRVLRKLPSWRGLSTRCLTQLARSVSFLEDEHITQDLAATVLQERMNSAIILLKDEILNLYYDDEGAMTQLYFALAKHQELTAVPNLITKIPPLRQSSARVQYSHLLLLRRCWRSTRNFQLFSSIYKAIRGFDPTQYPTKPMYLEVIRVCLEKGKRNEAALLLGEMTGDANFSADLETITMLLLPEAKRGNWDAVKDILFDGKGGPFEICRDDRGHFDKIFVEYCKQHCANQSLEFLGLLDARFSTAITPNMVDSLVDVIADEQDVSLATRLQKMMYGKGIEMRLTRKSLELIMKRLKRVAHLRILPWAVKAANGRADGQMLVGMLNDIVKHEGENGTYLAPYIKNKTWLPIASSTPSPNSKTPVAGKSSGANTGDYWRQVERLMLAGMRARRYERVLEIYRMSLQRQAPLRTSRLSIAVHAAILRDKNALNGAHEIIYEAQKSGISTEFAATPLLLREFRIRKWTEVAARSRIFEHYSFLESHQMRLNHYATLAAAQNLAHFSHDPRASLRLLNEVRSSHWAYKIPFDLPMLTIYLKLSIETCDATGIQWVLEQVHTRRMEIDMRFKRTLKNGRKRLIKFAREYYRVRLVNQPWRKQRLIQSIKHVEPWLHRFTALHAEQSDRSLDFASAFSKILRNGQDGQGLFPLVTA